MGGTSCWRRCRCGSERDSRALAPPLAAPPALRPAPRLPHTPLTSHPSPLPPGTQYAAMFASAGQPGEAKKVQASVATARKVFRVLRVRVRACVRACVRVCVWVGGGGGHGRLAVQHPPGHPRSPARPRTAPCLSPCPRAHTRTLPAAAAAGGAAAAHPEPLHQPQQAPVGGTVEQAQAAAGERGGWVGGRAGVLGGRGRGCAVAARGRAQAPARTRPHPHPNHPTPNHPPPYPPPP